MKVMNILLIFDIFCLIFTALGKNLINEKAAIFGKVVVIDPGHGGNDNGAEVDNVFEDEINLNISKILYEMLFNNGCIVHITRTSDYDLAPENVNIRKNIDLKKKTKFINEVDADIFVSIHLNIYSSIQINGLQVFYQKYKEDSEKLAILIQKEFNKNLNKKNKNVKIGDYYILNNTYPIGVLVECGFLTNFEERKNLVTKEYQESIALNIFNAIIKYFK